jgi:hypothetical protein
VYTGNGTGLIPLGVAALALLLYTALAPGWERRTNGTVEVPPAGRGVPDWERDQPTR